MVRQRRHTRKNLGSSDRLALLKLEQNRKMARSAHAYVRGNTLKFYEWLNNKSRAAIPEGPAIWICGDCHVGNLGPIASAAGRVDIQIRDLDQTVLGNPAHDLVRLGLSLATAIRGSDLPGVTTALMIEQIVRGYCDALSMRMTKERIIQAQTDQVESVLNLALRRRWKHLARDRIGDPTPKIPATSNFLALNDSDIKAIEQLIETEELRHLITALKNRPDDAKVRLKDAAFWIKGCSSLGLLRWAVLLKVGQDFCLLDFKEAREPLAPRLTGTKMPADNAMRVLSGAKALSPNLGGRMMATKIGHRSVFIRELLPQDLKLELEQLTEDQALHVARYLAGVVGHAHGRQMDRPTRLSWKKEVSKFSTRIDAPPWLWASVVELIALHEAAYLEHCRNYGLATRAA